MNISFHIMYSVLKAIRCTCKYRTTYRKFSSKRSLILGIETSCDDTGCAIVDSNGNILGESLNSQHIIHLNNGGIIPPIAQDLHIQNIESVVNSAIKAANIDFHDLDAIATTVKPGLPLSLIVGAEYGKYLCRKYKKPFIPIHHMEAHTLIARLCDQTLEFPFLVLLISGGHCLLALANNVDDFLLLGESLDDAPGEALDKMARRMKLKNLPEYSRLSGGQAIEMAAAKADDPLHFKLTTPLTQYKDCNFSFAGLKTQALLRLLNEEKKWDTPPDGVIPTVNNLCATFLLTITRHLCHRVQRGMEYCAMKELIPDDKKVLVVSGGVACNDFIAKGLEIVCDEMGYKLSRPPPKLCTDNGVMIAWNGVERWKVKSGVFDDFEDIRIEKKAPLGTNMIEDVTKASISCKWIKLTKLLKSYSDAEKCDDQVVQNQ